MTDDWCFWLSLLGSIAFLATCAWLFRNSGGSGGDWPSAGPF